MNEVGGARMRVFLVTATAALALGVAATTSAQVTAINGRIAYTVCDFNAVVGDRVCDIWSMNSDGTSQTNLTSTPAINESQPAWSTDGTRLAFMRGGIGGSVLVVMNADGSAAIDVTPAPSLQSGPSWSPDGTRIAVAREVQGTFMLNQDIIIINVDGTGEVNITATDTGLDFDEIEPAWSPDGTKIAFSAARFEQSVDPITGDPITLTQREIVTVNPDGSGELIVSVGAPGSDRARFLEEDRGPAWSPDSATLVFMSQFLDPCCRPWQIWRVSRDGTGAAVVSDDPNVNDMWPSFSPDGTLIAFSSTRGATSGQTDIYTIPASTSAPASTPATLVTAATATRLTMVGTADDPHWARQPGPQPTTFSLTVTLNLTSQSAGGFVASWPPGIVCGRDCSETYRVATTVLLVALPRPGSRFEGWAGACSGPALYCFAKIDQAKTVTATFSRR